MAATEAVRIVDRPQLDASDQHGALYDALASAYAEEHLLSGVAATGGYVDEVIEPAETRDRLAWALTARAGR
jgi:acetyl-CoA carboxylase carboxyltransferase component